MSARSERRSFDRRSLEGKKLDQLSRTRFFRALKFPALFPTCLAWRKEREISKAGKNSGLESCSNIYFPLSRYHKATRGLTRPHDAIQFHKSSAFIHDYFLCHLKTFFVPLHLEHFLLMFPRQQQQSFYRTFEQNVSTPTTRTRRTTTKLLLGPLSRARGQKAILFNFLKILC